MPEIRILIDHCDVERLLAQAHRITVRWDGPKRQAYRIKVFKKDGTHEYLPRFLLSAQAGQVVDHIDHNTLNNRRENLRIVTNAENLFNRRGAQLGNSHGNRNVTYNRRQKVWVVRIKFIGKVYDCGRFGTMEEAIEVAESCRQQIVAGEWVKKPRIHLRGTKMAELNRLIHQRDRESCVMCKVYVDPGEKFHHVSFKSQGGDDSKENGVTLCQDCHRKAHGPESKSIRQMLLGYLRGFYPEL